MTQYSATGIDLDPESIKEIVRGSILKAIDEKAQERLIAGAIDYLMTPRSTGYPHQAPEAPLTQVFNEAVRQAAQEIVFEAFKENPKVQEAITKAVHPMVQKLCEDDVDGLSEAMGVAFGEWLRKQPQQLTLG